jgi:hypothetical protein
MGRPKIFETPEILQKAFEQYMGWCAAYTRPTLNNKGGITDVPAPRIPTVGDFCEYNKIDRRTLYEYDQRPEYSDTIKSIHDRILERKHNALLNGEGNTTGLIFDLKCNHGWRDKQVIEHEGEVHVTLNLNK